MKKKFNRFFLLTKKKFFVILGLWFLAVVLHNLIYAFFLGIFGIEFEEPVFFLLATIGIPLYFIISIVYTLIKKLRKRR